LSCLVLSCLSALTDHLAVLPWSLFARKLPIFACDCIILIIRCWLSAIHFTFTFPLACDSADTIFTSQTAPLHDLESRLPPSERQSHLIPGYALSNNRIRARPATGRALSKRCRYCPLRTHDVCNLTPPSRRPQPSLATYRDQRNHLLWKETLTQSRQGQACRPCRHLLDNILARCF
jgi:hypothetical protein